LHLQYPRLFKFGNSINILKLPLLTNVRKGSLITHASVIGTECGWGLSTYLHKTAWKIMLAHLTGLPLPAGSAQLTGCLTGLEATL